MVELLTPVQRNMNVDLKSLRKALDEQLQQIRDLKSNGSRT